MKVALVHDYLAQDGGAERVLKSFHEIWPSAPIFVLIHDKKKVPLFNKENVRESFLSRMPFGRSSFQWYLPLMPIATESHNLKDFDVVVSTSSMFSKGVITSPNTLHISYCHTPPRFLWADNYSYISDLKKSRLVKWFLPFFIHRLRLWDRMSVDRVDHFIANSKTVRQRINKYYRRESDVIYPPVELKSCSLQKPADYFATGGRLVSYKKFDLIVKTFNRLKWPLKIFGIGPEMNGLKNIAKNNIEFLGQISEDDKMSLLSRARAFIHPQLEDFGITAIEAMACGRPVIAYSQGGALETVIPNETGVFFHKQTWESLLDKLMNFNYENWDSEKIHEHAMKFEATHFKNAVKKYIEDRLEEFRKGVNQQTLV
ncbi:MAG: glycosyltransferase [Patescibacteria group bacterium]